MSTVRCKKCNSLVASDKKKCHICGAKIGGTSTPVKILAVFFACLLLVTCYSGMTSRTTEPQTAPQASVNTEEADKAAEEKRLTSSAEAARREEREATQTAIYNGKQAVTKILFDPSSAKFGKVVYREPGIVCGYVNAKNKFGGYTGEQAFITLGGPNTTWIEGQSDGFEKMWNTKCASD